MVNGMNHYKHLNLISIVRRIAVVIATIAMSPKPSVTGLVPGIPSASPRAIASKNVVVIIPVATPPESNAIEENFSLEKKESIIAIA